MAHTNHEPGFILGVDTGTSKTHALVADLSGNALGFGESGPGNYEVVGESGLINVMSQAVEQAIQMAKIEKCDILAMGFGISGYDWPSEKPIMERAIESLGINGIYEYDNDATIGLIAGASEGWGIAVDAGTGNNVRGRDKAGHIGRITGNSIWFGEIGGGGEMVWLAMIAVIYAWTLRGPKTKLTQLFMEYAEVESEDALIEALALKRLQLPPHLAKDIIRLANEGDPVAKGVVTQSAQELAFNVNAVARQLNFQSLKFDVVLIGSVFKAGGIYIEPFRETIRQFAPQANLVHLTVPPVVGAVLLAAETFGISSKELRLTLLKSTKHLLV